MFSPMMRMLMHQVPLVGRKQTLFFQNLVGDGDLPEVVQEAAAAQRQLFFFAQAHKAVRARWHIRRGARSGLRCRGRATPRCGPGCTGRCRRFPTRRCIPLRAAERRRGQTTRRERWACSGSRRRRPRCRESCLRRSLRPVIMTTGIRRVSGAFFHSRQSSYPLFPGMMTSSSTRSGMRLAHDLFGIHGVAGSHDFIALAAEQFAHQQRCCRDDRPQRECVGYDVASDRALTWFEH